MIDIRLIKSGVLLGGIGNLYFQYTDCEAYHMCIRSPFCRKFDSQEIMNCLIYAFLSLINKIFRQSLVSVRTPEKYCTSESGC